MGRPRLGPYILIGQKKNLHTVGDKVVLPRCYQNSPHQHDLGRHAASPDHFGLLRLGCFGCPEYVIRDNS